MQAVQVIREAISSRPGRSPATAKTLASPSAEAPGSRYSMATVRCGAVRDGDNGLYYTVCAEPGNGAAAACSSIERATTTRISSTGPHDAGGGGNALSLDYTAIARTISTPCTLITVIDTQSEYNVYVCMCVYVCARASAPTVVCTHTYILYIDVFYVYIKYKIHVQRQRFPI